jgi:iron complex outermembrane receptor protein
MRKLSAKSLLLATTMTGCVLVAAPVHAQDATAPQSPAQAPATPEATSDETVDAAQQDADASQEADIVVTGTIVRRTDKETPSPVTVVTTESLDQKGISTIQEGLQSLAANNGPALTNSFTANGAFAAGASAVSLRGLSTNSTLVLFDGLRAAYYPLADDGSRNFVDLNTIPDDIVERVEVLRDGASSAYGADAIAGVVNIITKREFKGLSGRAETGLSSRGDADSYRVSLTAGTGDLDNDGYNAYISGFFYKSDKLMARDRPYPYNSDDLRQVCAEDGTCGANGVVGGLNADGVYTQGTGTGSIFYVRPYDPTNTTAAPGSTFQALNLNQCGGNGSLYTLTPEDRAYLNASGQAVNATAPGTVCQVDYTKEYGVISPDIKRFGVSGRVTAKLGDTMEAYGEVNFLQSTVSYEGFPGVIYGTANTGIFFPQFSTAGSAGRAAGSGVLALPVYVCPRTGGVSAVLVNGVATVPGCTAANGTLNPNNPFAADGNVARLVGRDLNETTYNETRTRAYRGALGLTGDINDNVSFDIGATAMHVDLRRKQDGYVYIQHLIDVLADGTYNVANPSATPQDVQDYLTPVNITNATSDQVQLQGIVNARLAELRGGPLAVAVGASARYEAVDAPSGNSDINGPAERYFTLNAFGTKGSRYIYSGFAEIVAPVLEQLELSASGRYDRYSSGQSAFSPKLGFKFQPVRELLLRGTWSKGFRIPSFGEANALPTTGFVTNNVSLFNDEFLAQYGCSTDTFNTCPTYIRSGSYGQTTLASPDLDPEKSRSFTAGILFEPVRNVSFTVDYYNIKKTGVITQPSNAPALLAYYNGQPIPDGYTVIPDAPDPNFPTATPRVGFIQSQLVNANTQKVSGLDFGVSVNYIRLTSNLDASYIIRLETEFPDGTKERYDGTLGNFNLTAGSGTPKWHGSWLNSVEFGDRYQLNGTINYFGGYDLSAQDQGTDYKDCGLNPGYSPEGCKIGAYVTFDLGGRVKLSDNVAFYGNVLNLFDKLPPIDVVTYGAHLYNPVQGGTGILGRYFKAGLKVDF